MVQFSEQKIQKFLAGEYVSEDTQKALIFIKSEFPSAAISESETVLRAVAAVQLGASPETVSKFLGWRDFEMFCAGFLRASGFSVTENVNLTKPRMQIDILARSPSVALTVDCKHWRHGMGTAALAQAASAQTERAKAVRRRMAGLEPLAVVVLVFVDVEARFIDGAAVVPIRALRGFLSDLPSFSDLLEFY